MIDNKMMKRIMGCILTIITVFLIINIVLFVTGNKNIYSVLKEQVNPTVLDLDEKYNIQNYSQSDQKIERDYTFELDQYYINDEKSYMCCRIKVTRQDENMKKITIEEEEFFGEKGRFHFSAASSDSSLSGVWTRKFSFIKTKEALYCYCKFASEEDITFDGNVYLLDVMEEKDPSALIPEQAAGKFTLK